MRYAKNDATFKVTLRGFDAIVTNSDQGDGFYNVILIEKGNRVFSMDVPVDIEEDESVLSGDAVNFAVNSTIDKFEADRGTLGQGAGALEVTSMKKVSFINDWFGLGSDCKDALEVLKGTPFEEQAFSLVQQIIELDYNLRAIDQGNAEYKAQMDKVCKNLTLLELELFKYRPKETKIIVIQGLKKYALHSWELEKIQEFLDQFVGSPLENKCLMLVQDYISLKKQLVDVDRNSEDLRNQRHELELALNNLVLENLQNQVEVKMPDFGVDAFPKVTQDVVSLMDNVEVEPGAFGEQGGFGEPAAFGGGMWAGKKSFHEDPTETPIEMLPAVGEGDWEEDYKRKEFQRHDKVTLSKDLVVAQFGEEKVVPKGTKGKVNGLFDGQGNCVYVWYDGFGIFRTPVDLLSK